MCKEHSSERVKTEEEQRSVMEVKQGSKWTPTKAINFTTFCTLHQLVGIPLYPDRTCHPHSVLHITPNLITNIVHNPKMPSLHQRIAVVALLLLVLFAGSDGQVEQWCVADEQTPEEELQAGIDWACGKSGGANCSKIQMNQPCYLPNTKKDHASYAFNNYFQKFKHKGGSCYFNGAAIVTDLDPSHSSCQYEYFP
ncbi:Glucan endo-1,3-beta-glucosidase 4 [Linum grandiflorum]